MGVSLTGIMKPNRRQAFDERAASLRLKGYVDEGRLTGRRLWELLDPFRYSNGARITS